MKPHHDEMDNIERVIGGRQGSKSSEDNKRSNVDVVLCWRRGGGVRRRKLGHTLENARGNGGRELEATTSSFSCSSSSLLSSLWPSLHSQEPLSTAVAAAAVTALLTRIIHLHLGLLHQKLVKGEVVGGRKKPRGELRCFYEWFRPPRRKLGFGSFIPSLSLCVVWWAPGFFVFSFIFYFLFLRQENVPFIRFLPLPLSLLPFWGLPYLYVHEEGPHSWFRTIKSGLDTRR